MSKRELAELKSLFGQSVVDDAITNKDYLNQWCIENAKQVADAASRLKAVIQNPHDAFAFVSTLEPILKSAFAIAILKD
jgi:hypothetical protein